MMKRKLYCSSARAIWFVVLVICTLVNVTFEIRRERVRKAKKEETTTNETETTTYGGLSLRGGKGDIGEIPEVELDDIGDVEEAYMNHISNGTNNKTAQWPEAKKIERQNKLAAVCTRAHFLHGGAMYELIEQAKVTDGMLHFKKKYKNKPKEPVRITVVRYKSDVEDKYYYLARGFKPTCVFYLEPFNNSKSDYYLSEYVQAVPMPTL